jgi:hypothetical protein
MCSLDRCSAPLAILTVVLHRLFTLCCLQKEDEEGKVEEEEEKEKEKKKVGGTGLWASAVVLQEHCCMTFCLSVA